jgi:hypothetical protein
MAIKGTISDYIAEQGTISIKQPPKVPEAVQILEDACACIGDRAAERDVESERSMAQAVKVFNAARGYDLDEEDGWIFMVCLKIVRARAGTKVNVDDYVDGAAYMALAGEAKCGMGTSEKND